MGLTPSGNLFSSFPRLFQATQVTLSYHEHQSSFKAEHPSTLCSWEGHLTLVNNAGRLEGGLYVSLRPFQDRGGKATSFPPSSHCQTCGR